MAYSFQLCSSLCVSICLLKCLNVLSICVCFHLSFVYVHVWTVFSCREISLCVCDLYLNIVLCLCLFISVCVCVNSQVAQSSALESVFMPFQWIISMHTRECWDYTVCMSCFLPILFLTSFHTFFSLSLSPLSLSLPHFLYDSWLQTIDSQDNSHIYGIYIFEIKHCIHACVASSLSSHRHTHLHLHTWNWL